MFQVNKILMGALTSDLNVLGIFSHRILTSDVATVDHLNLSLGVAYFLLLFVMAAAFWLIDRSLYCSKNVRLCCYSSFPNHHH